MDNGEPLPSYDGLAAAFAKAKAEKERQESQGLRARSGHGAAANKHAEAHFKAAHGILVTFFTAILYSATRPQSRSEERRVGKECPV